ncbi:tripartite tricarboxylate transporter TctB family protein [Egicoccus sp. AB-alg2]|uniref:tripartite tricarboxylate transporter TctB family protein n=1 Tax=Egicoccus sp. AB-alg2 TaxID=3242693 RepID=UPI00359E96C9
MDTFRVTDRTIGLVVGVLATVYLVAAWRITAFSLGNVPVQSRAFPLGLGLALLTMSLVLVTRPSAATAADDDEDGDVPATTPAEARPIPHRTDDDRVEVAVLLLGAVAYVVAFVPLGFVVSTILYVVAMAWWFSQARLWVAFVVASVLAVGGQFAFAELLRVRLPGGLLAPLGF